MVSKQVIQIIIEAEEKVSQVAKKAENALDKLGNAGKKGMNGINTASSKTQSMLSKLSAYVEKARAKFNELRNNGQSTWSILKQGISSAANSFGKLITNSNTAKLAMEKIKSVSDGIRNKISQLQTKITTFGSSAKSSLTSAFNLSNVKTKLSQIGTNIDKLKAKLRSLANEAKSTGGGLGFLKNAASMAAGMIGYDLLNNVIEAGRAALNAQSQFDYFGQRLQNMTGKSKLSANGFKELKNQVNDLQKEFRKVDMTAVGATAEEIAVKMKLPADKIGDLTRMTAVLSSTFVKEGRTQEDAILAVSDALDGQFKRLQEIGISQDDLKKNGWSGDLKDQAGLIDALNKTMQEMGYEQTAKDITNLDEAFTALSISGGSLLRSVLVPITPTLISIMETAMGAVDGIQGFISQLQSAWAALPDWGKMAIGVGALAIALGILVPALMAVEVASLPLVGTLMGIAGAVMAISWPVVAVVAAIGLLVVAIYKVGQAFGWWKDIGGMLAAIQSGIMRLWSAFINHPDVQAAIKAISDGLQAAGKWVSWAGKQVLEFFGISSGAKWDIVASIIHTIGDAWNSLKGAVGNVMGFLQALYDFAAPIGQAIYEALKPIICVILGCSPGIVPALQTVYSVFQQVWNSIMAFLAPIISIIVNTVNRLINVFNQFKNGQISLPGLIVSVLTLLWNAYQSILSKIISYVLKFASQMLSNAIKAGKNFLNGVMNQLKQLPGKAYTTLMKVVSKIISAGTSWVTNAKNKAKAVVDGVYTKLSEIPGKIQSALNGVKDAIVKPFQDAYNTAKGVWDKIVSMASNTPSVHAGYDYLEGQNPDGSWGNTPTKYAGYETSSVTNEIDGELTLVHDLKNVPSDIDEDLLARLIIEGMKDPEVGKIIAENMGFQNWDSKIKNVLAGKVSRARGV